jgi:hypothetical protein
MCKLAPKAFTKLSAGGKIALIDCLSDKSIGTIIFLYILNNI